MQRKPQQQTLSIRIPNTLREFLEQYQQVISNGGRESVSISDVAKNLLESAKDDRLDFRLEAAELLRSSTECLCRNTREVGVQAGALARRMDSAWSLHTD